MKKVKIYTWQTCPFCFRAKKLLKREGIAYEEIKIDGDNAALDALKEISGIRSVPQIFVNDEFIGGCDTIHDIYEQGDFERLFKGE